MNGEMVTVRFYEPIFRFVPTLQRAFAILHRRQGRIGGQNQTRADDCGGGGMNSSIARQRIKGRFDLERRDKK
jgi:hypothetical protein